MATAEVAVATAEATAEAAVAAVATAAGIDVLVIGIALRAMPTILRPNRPAIVAGKQSRQTFQPKAFMAVATTGASKVLPIGAQEIGTAISAVPTTSRPATRVTSVKRRRAM